MLRFINRERESVLHVNVCEETGLGENLGDLFLVDRWQRRQTEPLAFSVQSQRKDRPSRIGYFLDRKLDAFRDISFLGRLVSKAGEKLRNVNFLRAAVLTDLTRGTMPNKGVLDDRTFPLLQTPQENLAGA
jgi:hypothetical protein